MGPEHAICKLLTVPCEMQSCARSFGSPTMLGRDGSHLGQSKAIGIPLQGVCRGFGSAQRLPLLKKLLGADADTARGSSQRGWGTCIAKVILRSFDLPVWLHLKSLTSLCLPNPLLQMQLSIGSGCCRTCTPAASQSGFSL